MHTYMHTYIHLYNYIYIYIHIYIYIYTYSRSCCKISARLLEKGEEIHLTRFPLAVELTDGVGPRKHRLFV